MLSVEFTSFTAALLGSSVSLNRSAATEVNTYGFNIERNCISDDLGSGPSVTEWEKIGFVPGNGNSNSPKNCSFVNPTPPADPVLYRLKQIDNYNAATILALPDRYRGAAYFILVLPIANGHVCPGGKRTAASNS